MTQTLLSPLLAATILADSISEEGVRLTTMELVYPRFIHSELMTHRVFSRNASSSRAIPTKRAIKMIREHPAVPASWRMNQPGMQGYEFAPDDIAALAQDVWLEAMESAIRHAEAMDALGIHKQVVNRITEPFAHIKVVVTSVYWDNWFGLRDHPAADPTIAALAAEMRKAYDASTPKLLKRGEWHLPYFREEDHQLISDYLSRSWTEQTGESEDTMPLCPLDEEWQALARNISAARCARTSYNNHDNTPNDVAKDIDLHNRLLKDQPIHASPAEHQATPDFKINQRGMWMNPKLHGNLHGWIQYRKTLENETMDTPILG